MGLYATLTALILKVLSVFLPEKSLHTADIFFRTLPRDLGLICTLIRLIINYVYYLTIKKVNAVSLFEDNFKRNPNKTCIIFEDEVWTFKEVNDFSNRIAQIFQRAGLKKGDVVALVMTNRPEFACIWLGLAKIGVITAFVNSNLKDKPLIHSIESASSKAVIYSSDVGDAIKDVKPSLSKDIKIYQLGTTCSVEGAIQLEDIMKTVSPTEPVRDFQISLNDRLVYVYTSGTTGLPKAAILPHSRYVQVALFVWELCDLRRDDVVYCPLPLYHAMGGIMGTSSAFGRGATVVMKKKFTASGFIEDCIRHKCTVAQYIGEICRFVLSVPPKPTDRQHKIRVFAGVGLKECIWKEFITRFNIPNVREMYGSTEGNLILVNRDNTVGAVGFIPRFIPLSSFMGRIIRVDPDTMEPIRGPDGLCVEADIDEPGMFVGIISNSKLKKFYGYVDKKETQKKYIFDVFKKGDKAFVTGDVLVKDELGYLYFKDRTGDTFRWKGENVSTAEVEGIISNLVGLRDCIVYGVQVGQLEGKAGMVAIADQNQEVDVSALPAALDKTLPKYAQPVFIRILLQEVEMTGTFKLKKMNLVKEAFNPSLTKDPLFFRKGATYIPLTQELYEQIIAGKVQM